jgi:tetratricopeptide (TPR) repeat protein
VIDEEQNDMTRKKANKKQTSKDLLSANSDPRQMMEQVMRDMQKLLQESGVESVEEANELLQQVMASGGRPPHSTNLSALERAQDMMYRAWEARSRSQAVKLAREALKISPDCADAYVLLAQATAKNVEEAKDLYQKGVEAGKRALGEEFNELVGEFWGFLETRPYMRAREGLAMCLWQMGEKPQAIEHYEDMLRLNPNDNQGIRDVLLDCFLEMEQWEKADKLIKKYKDDASAAWVYSQAFLLFRKEGASKNANKTLQKAMDYNHFVPQYLLGKKKLPKHMPMYRGFGDENEAVDYAASGIRIWQKNPAALEWLQKMVESYTPKSRW